MLASVAREGRFLTGDSPEQVGAALGISGRTVRRLERGDGRGAPRELTLEALAGYYAFDASVLKWLARAVEVGDALSAAIADRAEAVGVSSNGRAHEVALRLARARPPRVGVVQSGDADEAKVLRNYRRLDPRRRELARAFLVELRLARSEERRRSEGEQYKRAGRESS